MRNIFVGTLLAFMTSAGMAQQQNIGEASAPMQILEQQVGRCIGENARIVAALNEARAQVAALQKQVDDAAKNKDGAIHPVKK